MYLVGLFLGLFFGFHSNDEEVVEHFIIAENSEIELFGNSSFGGFSCESPVSQAENDVQLEYTVVENNIYFQNARILVPVSSFDCGVKKLTTDMQSLLHADEYPEIAIQLIMFRQTVDNSPMLNENSDQGSMVMDFMIAGKESRQETAVVRKWNEESFTLKGQVILDLNDFGIEPPKPLFGLMEVSNEVEVHFDLTLKKI
tara:strand:+ start:1555 stop:2154 length:600 start_codon:yes stop_codon:yes gene_type:complete